MFYFTERHIQSSLDITRWLGSIKIISRVGWCSDITRYTSYRLGATCHRLRLATARSQLSNRTHWVLGDNRYCCISVNIDIIVRCRELNQCVQQSFYCLCFISVWKHAVIRDRYTYFPKILTRDLGHGNTVDAMLVNPEVKFVVYYTGQCLVESYNKYKFEPDKLNYKIIRFICNAHLLMPLFTANAISWILDSNPLKSWVKMPDLPGGRVVSNGIVPLSLINWLACSAN